MLETICRAHGGRLHGGSRPWRRAGEHGGDLLLQAELRQPIAERAIEQLRQARTLVVAREQAAFVFERVPEGDMRDVVQQRGDADQLLQLRLDARADVTQRRNHPLGARVGPQRVIEARVHAAGIDQAALSRAA